ncbi:hypothetical protein DJ519_30225 [Klebsiella michiganensis]|nr:hypothetical protein DJ519_30225 [Klebsiella michiganensis]
MQKTCHLMIGSYKAITQWEVLNILVLLHHSEAKQPQKSASLINNLGDLCLLPVLHHHSSHMLFRYRTKQISGNWRRWKIYKFLTRRTADRNRSHWSTKKTPSYTKSVSWQHHPSFNWLKSFNQCPGFDLLNGELTNGREYIFLQ